MNLVGKIFIVLIFVMSILFMGFVVAVYATHTNWRNVVTDPDTGLETQLKNVQVEVDRLTTQMAKTEEELDRETQARQNQLALLETQKELLAKERDQLTKDIANQSQQARDAIGAMKAAHDSLAALRAEVVKLRADILSAIATRDAAIGSLVAKTDDANILAIEMQTLQKKAVDTTEQLTDAMEVLRKFNLKSEPSIYTGTPPTGLAGIVTAAPAGESVQISLGTDDGLLVGHHLDVYRISGGLSTYLGKIEVYRARADEAVCRILPEFRKGIIQVNDRVTTGLKSQ